MYEKLPFYMAYPLLFSCDNDRAERMDSEYLKSLYPDKLQLRLMCRRACENAAAHEEDLDRDQLWDLTGVILCEELYRRRCGRRRRNRRFY